MTDQTNSNTPNTSPADSDTLQPSQGKIAAPKCPACAITGIEHIVSVPSQERSRAKQPWFYIIQCANCGHVYNTLSKHTFTQPVTPKFVLPKSG